MHHADAHLSDVDPTTANTNPLSPSPDLCNSKHAVTFSTRRLLGGFVRRPLVLGAALLMTSALAIGLTNQMHADSLKVSESDRQALAEASKGLKETSNAYRALARVAEPSVVYVSVLADPVQARQRSRVQSFGPEEIPEEFREFFEERFGPEFFENRQRGRQQREQAEEDNQYNALVPVGAGSGWIWSEDGYIVTNNHVVANGQAFEVVFVDGSKVKAELVGTDDKTDIAVLKVDRDGLTPFKRAKEDVQQGDLVFAFGSPFRYRFSMSNGIVSGVGRDVGILRNARGYENFIQTDAAINPGNSGGPLVDVEGQVVGMNTAIATQTGQFAGIGFAIPMDMIEEVVPQLIDGGQVVRGFIGAMIDDTPETVQSFGATHGVVIGDIVEGGPAADSDLKIGDVVVAINGEDVHTAQDLRGTVARIRPGETAKFEVLRDGKEKTVRVKVGKLTDAAIAGATGQAGQPDGDQPADHEVKALDKLGITGFETFTEDIADELGWSHEPGVVITQVRPGSVAATRGLRRGMVITRVQGTRTPELKSLANALKGLDPEDGIRFRVRVDEDREVFVVLRMTAY